MFEVFFSKLWVKSHSVSIGDFEKCNSGSSQCKSLSFVLCVCFCIFRVGSSKGGFSHLYREKKKGD